jgi:hypothetical protein
MNRWARRHRETLVADLDDGEELLVACRVAISRRSPFRSHFPAPGRIFAIGLTDRRLVLYRCSRWMARPEALATSVPLPGVSSMTKFRRLGGTRLRVTLDSGPIAVLEPVWGGALGGLADVYSGLAAR